MTQPSLSGPEQPGQPALTAYDVRVLDAMSQDPERAWFIGDLLEALGGPNLYRRYTGLSAWRYLGSVFRTLSTGGIYPSLARLQHLGLVTRRWSTEEDVQRSPALVARREQRRAAGEKVDNPLKVSLLTEEGRRHRAKRPVPSSSLLDRLRRPVLSI